MSLEKHAAMEQTPLPALGMIFIQRSKMSVLVSLLLRASVFTTYNVGSKMLYEEPLNRSV